VKRALFTRVIPTLAFWLIRALHGTLRVRHVDLENIEALHRAGRPYVFAFWHSQLLVMLYARFGKPMVPLISQHRDGDMIARTMARFGHTAARGSTTRGGIGALKEMIRHGRQGSNLAITPDGPRGPRHVAQAGAIVAAQLTGGLIMPAAFTAKKKNY
jgi:lysophospholipid acyltransferase (LPLAT)-like uncharacterized protein